MYNYKRIEVKFFLDKDKKIYSRVVLYFVHRHNFNRAKNYRLFRIKIKIRSCIICNFTFKIIKRTKREKIRNKIDKFTDNSLTILRGKIVITARGNEAIRTTRQHKKPLTRPINRINYQLNATLPG